MTIRWTLVPKIQVFSGMISVVVSEHLAPIIHPFVKAIPRPIRAKQLIFSAIEIKDFLPFDSRILLSPIFKASQSKRTACFKLDRQISVERTWTDFEDVLTADQHDHLIHSILVNIWWKSAVKGSIVRQEEYWQCSCWLLPIHDNTLLFNDIFVANKDWPSFGNNPYTGMDNCSPTYKSSFDANATSALH